MNLEFRGIHEEILRDETPELDIEGARMSGKTWVCSAKVHNSCVKHPGIWWLINRYSGTETDNQLRPQFAQVCRMLGSDVAWNNEESAYHFPAVGGKVSKVFAYGLKTQSKEARFSKIRGSGVSGLWNDQSEEMPEDIATEMRALLRQPGGYPYQLMFSPNPPDEEHFLADQFPDDQDLPGRKYYRLSLYDNRHNLRADTIEMLERAYPRTHAKHKSLILGMRGPNITGTPVYEHAFQRETHVSAITYDPNSALLEAFDAGKHHPTWLVAQRSTFGGINILGGILGKRLFLEDFLPLVARYRREWFDEAEDTRVCCDPPMSNESGLRYTTADILREAKLRPRWRENASAPDVRVSMIEHIGAMMLRRAGAGQAFNVNADASRWLMASKALAKPKHTKLFVDGCEGSYVWSPNYVSVGNKTVRQPAFDQWLDGWQRCLENIMLNFVVGQATQAEKDEKRRKLRAQQALADSDGQDFSLPGAWMKL